MRRIVDNAASWYAHWRLLKSGRACMRYKVKSSAALKLILGDLPDKTRVQVDREVKVSAKTVGDLRKLPDWPEPLALAIPRESDGESVVKVSRPGTATRTSPKQ